MQVNDGSCLSNMQCVMSSDAEGYDQVLPTAYFFEFIWSRIIALFVNIGYGRDLSLFSSFKVNVSCGQNHSLSKRQQFDTVIQDW